jgi:hypothetical protein
MDTLILILVFFGGIILLLSIGWLIGRLLKLDDYEKEIEKERDIESF